MRVPPCYFDIVVILYIVNNNGEKGLVMDVKVSDKLIMKKPHPCGCNEFLVTRVGMDFKIKCTKCSHEVMVPRKKVEKNIKRIIRDDES